VRNESLIEVKRCERKGDWPSYYVITNDAAYEYAGASFVRTSVPTAAGAVQLPSGYSGTQIKDVRGDGESAIIQLLSGAMIAFELVHDITGPSIQSYPSIRFVEARDAQTWLDEYEAMDPL
jgi:hypothetical protein